MPKLYAEIGRRITALCTSKGWTQQDLGRVVGMTRGGAAMLQRGKGRILPEHLYNIASAANVRVTSLLP